MTQGTGSGLSPEAMRVGSYVDVGHCSSLRETRGHTHRGQLVHHRSLEPVSGCDSYFCCCWAPRLEFSEFHFHQVGNRFVRGPHPQGCVGLSGQRRW